MSTPRLATKEADGWWLADGEVSHAESPGTFWIPPASERRSLSLGSIVKLRCFIIAPDDSGELIEQVERMWVEVTERQDEWYRGILDNDAYCTDRLSAGTELWFQPRHVIDINQR